MGTGNPRVRGEGEIFLCTPFYTLLTNNNVLAVQRTILNLFKIFKSLLKMSRGKYVLHSLIKICFQYHLLLLCNRQDIPLNAAVSNTQLGPLQYSNVLQPAAFEGSSYPPPPSFPCAFWDLLCWFPHKVGPGRHFRKSFTQAGMQHHILKNLPKFPWTIFPFLSLNLSSCRGVRLPAISMQCLWDLHNAKRHVWPLNTEEQIECCNARVCTAVHTNFPDSTIKYTRR